MLIARTEALLAMAPIRRFWARLRAQAPPAGIDLLRPIRFSRAQAGSMSGAASPITPDLRFAN